MYGQNVCLDLSYRIIVASISHESTWIYGSIIQLLQMLVYTLIWNPEMKIWKMMFLFKEYLTCFFETNMTMNKNIPWMKMYLLLNLDGGFKYVLFPSLFGEDFQFYSYFSDGLKPASRNIWWFFSSQPTLVFGGVGGKLSIHYHDICVALSH